MNCSFLDSSAIVKRYAVEAGSVWVTAITDPGSVWATALSEITLVEVAAALAAKTRASGGLSVQARDQALTLFFDDCRKRFSLFAITRAIIDLAVALTKRHALRGYDAVQLATALVANGDLIARGEIPLLLVTADQELLTAGQAEGLVVEDPNSHP